jgi:alanyl-tRNA synthetase
MERQRERARVARDVTIAVPTVTIGVEVFTPEVYTEPNRRFVGYDVLSHSSSVVWLRSDGKSQESVREGQQVEVVLDRTPFYGEMGGQVGDTGEIRGPQGRIMVANTVRTPNDITIHQGKVVEGKISVGDAVEAEVDEKRRLDIARNHTATHLLQAALRQVLGEHVRQSGSLVAPDRLRFDFTHPKALTRKELSQIQHLVNEKIRQNLKVRATMMPYQQALDRGALAFFEEHYGEEVRVLEIGKPRISAELCGGTHVGSTGEIGLFHIVGESSIGAGMRRIEAVTGRGAEEFVAIGFSIIEEAAQELRVSPPEIKGRISALHAELDAERKRAIALERELQKKTVDSLLNRAETVNGVTVLAARVPASNMEALRQMGDLVKERLSSVVVVLGAVYNDQANFVAMVTPDLVKRGLSAAEIVKQVAAITGGSGGGRAELGQAGGKDKDKLDEALALVRGLVERV